jgi:hypothetical protein
MKTAITGLVAALALTGGAATPAEAAPIRECAEPSGSFYSLRVVNLTTRNVRCRVARARSWRAITTTGIVPTGVRWWFPRLNMYCTATRLTRTLLDMRCTRGRYVIHWQTRHPVGGSPADGE